MRSINIRTSDSVRSGLKISNTAITTRDYYTVPPVYIHNESDGGNYLLTEGTEGFIQTRVVVADEDGDFAYIPVDTLGLAPGIRISAAEQPLYVIPAPVSVTGVYKVNNGYTEFERIVLNEEEPPSGSYLILDQALNPDIKTYDYIVTNASEISERQPIN
jgi:hypothetical protein